MHSNVQREAELPSYMQAAHPQQQQQQQQFMMANISAFGIDPNNVEAVKGFRDSLFRKRAVLFSMMAAIIAFGGFIPLIMISNFPTALVAFPVFCCLLSAYLLYNGWSTYKKIAATPYIAGTPLFTGSFL